MTDWKDAVHDAKYVHCDDDIGLTVVWNGSATFNVYADTADPTELNPIDCFTRYACPEGYGPEDAGMSFAEGVDWAERAIQNWLDDNFRPGASVDYSKLSREACVRLLEESAGIQCYGEESVEELREAVRVNVMDETIPLDDLQTEMPNLV